jgi:hypothetical protein
MPGYSTKPKSKAKAKPKRGQRAATNKKKMKVRSGY